MSKNSSKKLHVPSINTLCLFIELLLLAPEQQLLEFFVQVSYRPSQTEHHSALIGSLLAVQFASTHFKKKENGLSVLLFRWNHYIFNSSKNSSTSRTIPLNISSPFSLSSNSSVISFFVSTSDAYGAGLLFWVLNSPKVFKHSITGDPASVGYCRRKSVPLSRWTSRSLIFKTARRADAETEDSDWTEFITMKDPIPR